MSNFITTKDGVDIFYKDWGSKDAQPIMFHHGWPLSSDDWDAQMLFFLSKGYRVVAHDRRGHGRSAQVDVGHDMAHYAADAAAVAEQLDLRNAVHIGHSTGGGEVAAYVARHGIPQGRVDKAVLVSAVPPIMVKTDRYPGGLGYCEKAVERIDQPEPAAIDAFDSPGRDLFLGDHRSVRGHRAQRRDDESLGRLVRLGQW